MKIQHLANSFIVVTTQDAKIVCDPWVGMGNHGGWHSFPEYRREDLEELVRDCTHVYISHLHSDHLDPAFLKSAGLTQKQFVVKKFAVPAMRNRLTSLGVAQITEVEEFSRFPLTPQTSISIIPQMTSNNAAAQDQIGYDLDTSIVFNSGGTTFFNQVDNPLSLADFGKVADFVSSTYGPLDVACFVCGAAGEFPQCFIGIDRDAFKRKIIDASLAKLRQAVTLMRPRHTFIAGGTYFIPGKFHLLNEYIAQPSPAQVADCVAGITQLLELEGGQALTLEPNGVVELTRDITPSSASFSESVRAHSSDSYAHQTLPTVSLDELAAKFAAASANRAEKLSRSGVKIGRRILFKAYDDLQTDFDLNIPSAVAATFALEPTDPEARQQDYIVIHLDRQAMYGCLTRKLIWNQVLSGSLCLFERVPNTHEPDLLFSLNFLVA